MKNGNLYDPDRLQKIGEIMPNLCKYAEIGDEITLGLKGDPEFPSCYRGSSRPTGVIEKIQSVDDGIMVTAKMNDGTLMNLPSTTIGAYNTWEFTDEGFEKVLSREEDKARSEAKLSEVEPVEYRGSDSYDTKLARLEQEMLEKDQLNDSFRKTVVQTFKAMASEVSELYEKMGVESKFCGALSSRYDELVSKSEKEYRGTKETYSSDVSGSDDDDDNLSSVHRSSKQKSEYNEKLMFSEDEELLSNPSSDED